jgi:Domain of unknown function (DUF5069)
MQYPRSPHDKVDGLVYFGRMFDKITLDERGELPTDYVENLGGGFDKRCCNLLDISYDQFRELVKSGVSEEAALKASYEMGRRPSDEEIEIWNEFLRKRGWNDEATEIVERRKRESGLEDRTDIVTMFDYIDADEGRAIQK